LKLLVDFHEVQQGRHAIECDIDAMIFNPVAPTIPTWRTLKLLKLMQKLHQSTWEKKGNDWYP
jgi:hypothetical protein